MAGLTCPMGSAKTSSREDLVDWVIILSKYLGALGTVGVFTLIAGAFRPAARPYVQVGVGLAAAVVWTGMVGPTPRHQAFADGLSFTTFLCLCAGALTWLSFLLFRLWYIAKHRTAEWYWTANEEPKQPRNRTPP